MSATMNVWTSAAVVWLWLGIWTLALCWFWYEADGNVRRTAFMRLVELLFGLILWPLAAYSTWIWWKCRCQRNEEFQRLGIPHCDRHGHILLQCKEQHEAFCQGCSGACKICDKDAWFSPRYHGHSASGEPVVVYERIYVERPEWMQERA